MQLADAQRATQVAATLERVARREQRSQMQEAYQRAALGLAHLQQGLDELHRRAHAHRQLGQRLEEARGLLGRPELSAEDAPVELARLQAERTSALTARARHERARDSASCRVDETKRALAALLQLEAAIASVESGNVPASVESLQLSAAEEPQREALSRARRVLARLVEHDDELRRSSGLEQDRVELERRATRQQSVRERAQALGLGLGSGARATFERRLVELEDAVRSADLEVRAAEQRVLDARTQRLAAQESRSALEQRVERWEVLRSALTRVGEAHSSAAAAAEPEAELEDDSKAELSTAAELSGVAETSLPTTLAPEVETSPAREAKPRRRRARKVAPALAPKPLLPALRSPEGSRARARRAEPGVESLSRAHEVSDSLSVRRACAWPPSSMGRGLRSTRSSCACAMSSARSCCSRGSTT